MSSTNPKSDGRLLSNLFFRVLPAQIFLVMLTRINNIVDGLVGSNFLGPKAMSIIGLYTPFQLVWVAVGNVLVVGSQVLCARYMGAGDLKRTRGVFSLNITIALAAASFGLLLSLALHKGEDIFMSLKDDCIPYNPQERADFIDPKDDSPKSMSIRLFMGIVKETEYQLTLGINVFTMTV